MKNRLKHILNFYKGLFANLYYSFPSKKIKTIGVTGTDGKTTTSNIIYHILQNSGIKTGLVSTVNAKIGKNEYDTGFHVTNPAAFKLQKLLRKMVNSKLEYSVLEVTSHGLDQNRNYGINFEIGVLTNITHEHLDYHKTFKNYVRAKAKLFQKSKVCIINRKYYKYFKKYIADKQKVILYDENSLDKNILKVVRNKFNEQYNVLNATAAILVAKEIGINDTQIIKAIKTFGGVVGRMQEVKNKKGIKIIVDFAHTPNALENLLQTLKKQKPKNAKLITVFGCAGERDIQKRPMMAEISTRLSDASIFTAEDPRHENVLDIITQMQKGVRRKNAKVLEIPDRFNAIKQALSIAKKGDVIAICGKGHEKSMAFGDVEKPWSDVKAVDKVLKQK